VWKVRIIDYVEEHIEDNIRKNEELLQLNHQDNQTMEKVYTKF
jgi:hypothetical protein